MAGIKRNTPKTCSKCDRTWPRAEWPRYVRGGRLTAGCPECNALAIQRRPFGRQGRDPVKGCSTCKAPTDKREMTNGYCRPCWNERKKAYRHANPARDVAWKAIRLERLIAQSDGTVTDAGLRQMFALAKRCPYCNLKMKTGEKSLDHVTPLVLGGEHSMRNLVVCCLDCNTRKGRQPLERWLDRCKGPHAQGIAQALLF